MSEAYWQSVRNSGMPVPTERPIADSAAELIAMLGDSRPHVRDSLVLRILSTWLASGAFDQSLAAFGDGILPGLERGLGTDGDDTVYRRSYSALLLAHVLGRDNTSYVLDETTVMRWGDRASNWLLHERDHRGWTGGQGWAHSIAHGADFIAAIGSSRHCGGPELRVLLDVVADRLVESTHYAWRHGEHDRLAYATMTILRRNQVEWDAIETWSQRLGAALQPSQTRGHSEWPTPTAGNVSGFLRSLQLQLAMGVHDRPELTGENSILADQPTHRSDIVLTVLDQVRAGDSWVFR